MTGSAIGKITKSRSLSILQRIADKDRTAVKDCIDAYGHLIWSLAKKFTDSAEEAETASREIFIDIWRHAHKHGDETQITENILIIRIARQRLLKPRPPK